ncbi:GNAT family N-acetyltransferase [Pukyongiella litopenaei]|uniref:GNAT family N-acetyltransferase n=1 Tax=Pukyongiella litopenaei TaxID=2605946 RepID=A0A2S0MRC9_9RHOB|nr:GNAT family N-acetyltransferase [Pukyongiella litopenaei]AVO38387.1 GNAT family N-acetyltransferase [Pukyongiella litopenaei]
MAVTISVGFDEAERPVATRLFWQAFSAKLGRVLGPEDRALRFLEPVLYPQFAITARDAAGTLVGLAGFKTDRGGLVGGTLRDLAAVYGWFGALWRGALLSVFERDLEPGVFQMDGLCVDATSRGMGVGTALLDAVMREAAARGLEAVQLDVIDSNPRARALYERFGFQAVGSERIGPLRHVFGFSGATRMRLPVSRTPRPPG